MGAGYPLGNKAAVDRLDGGSVTPGDAAGSRLAATATPLRGRRPQAVEGMVRPARFERATYRFVARAHGSSGHHQEEPSTTKDRESPPVGPCCHANEAGGRAQGRRRLSLVLRPSVWSSRSCWRRQRRIGSPRSQIEEAIGYRSTSPAKERPGALVVVHRLQHPAGTPSSRRPAAHPGLPC
jgi:hypothetical protein